MSTVRWDAVDKRHGSSWRGVRARQRVRNIAVSAIAVVGLGASALAAGASPAPNPAAEEIRTSYEAELAALEAEGIDRIALLRADAAALSIEIDAGLASALAGLRAAADADIAAVQASTAEHIALIDIDRANAQVALKSQFDRDAVALDEFITGIIEDLERTGKQPTRDAQKSAEQEIKTRAKGITSELKAVLDAERSEFDAAEEAAFAAIEAAEEAADAAYELRAATLDAAFDADEAEMEARLDAAASAFAEAIDSLKDEHSQQVDQLKVASEIRLDGAVDGADEREIKNTYKQQLEGLKDFQDEELATTRADFEALSDQLESALDRLEVEYKNDLEAAKASLEILSDRLDAEARTLKDDLAEADKRLSDEHKIREKRLESYKRAIDAVEGGAESLRKVLADQIDDLWDEHADRLAALNGRFDDKVELVIEAAARDIAAIEQSFLDAAARSRQQAAARHDLAETELDADIAAVERRIERRRFLAQSEYYALSRRAEAFFTAGGFTSLGATFDPATDPGSLYNVAKRIGADHTKATGAGIDVAIIDTGISDVDGLADADVVIGPDFSFDEIIPELRGVDANGHGSHLGAIIAGRDELWNTGDTERRPERFLGIAPGARLVSVKAGAADGGVDVTQIIAAINWVIANKNADDLDIRVLNLSFGTDAVQDYEIDPLAHAVERAWHAGIVVVVAAGNEGWDSERLTNPAQNPYVIAVGASQAVDGRDDVPSSYSNGTPEGVRHVDIVAPGRSIVSVRVPGSFSDEQQPFAIEGGYVRGSGTSQAAAVVSGAAALVLSERPELSPDQVKQVLMESADSDHDADPTLVGAGYLRVNDAINETPRAWVPQTWEESTGAGTLDGARGSLRVVHNERFLEGEQDIFGNDFSGSRWSEDSWTGRAWTGSRWSGRAWTGSRWSGSRWSSELWTGRSWTGSRWSADAWTGSRWSGRAWTGSRWSGSRWSGSRWSGSRWSGAGWSSL